MFGLPLAATMVAVAFAISTWRAAHSRGPALRVWAFSLVQFAVASAALTWGVLFGWTSALYRVFYLFGAVLNVGWLALGTVHLIADRWAAAFATVLLVAVSAYAVYRIGGTGLVGGSASALRAESLPPPSEVIPGGVRMLSRWFSIGGSVVVLAGLIAALVRRRHVLGLALLALGVVVVALAGELAREGIVWGFSAALAVGITVMYAGFRRTRTPRREST